MSRAYGVAAGLDPSVARPLAATCEKLNYASIWSNDHPGAKGLETLAEFAGASERIGLGVGVIALDRRPADEIAEDIERLGLDRERLWLGVGAGFSEKPLTKMREALPELREKLPGVRLVLAAMGPKMCALAGAEYDGAFFNWMTPGFAAKARERVLEGAADAGRDAPPVYGYVRTAVGPDAQRRLAKEESFYRDLHDGYRNHFDRLGEPEGTVGIAAADADDAQRELAAYEALDVPVVRGLASANIEAMTALAEAGRNNAARLLLAVVLTLAMLSTGALAQAKVSPEKRATPNGPLGHSGRWITDRSGRVVILHGFNMVYKRPPYAPDAVGFGADDAAFLKRHGFNTLRLGLIYKAIEPQPGVFDEGYLSRVARTERQLSKRGVFTQIDFHQDLYNERFSGEGWPDWAVLDDGFPAEPLGFPGSYISSPGLNRSFDNFWANKAGPGGVGLQDRYAAAWRRVAEVFRKRPRMMGYDLMNEPWPGTPWTTCANPAGCPAFDGGVFTDFYERTIDAIRQADQRNLIWYEPNVVSTFGADSNVDSLQDRKLGYSYHVYCLAGALGGPGGGDACGTAEELTFGNADKQAEQTGSALLMSEFGATDDLETIRRISATADDHMVSWQEWHYCGCADPTTQGPGDVQAIVLDPAKAPRGDNLKRAKLRLLARAYPQAVSGTPQAFSFDPASARFDFSYLTRRASGKGRFRRGLTDVFVPKLHYPKGYRVKVRGAKQVGRRGDQHLILRANRRAKRVTLVVTPRRPGT